MKLFFSALLIIYSCISQAQIIPGREDNDSAGERAGLRAQFPRGENGWSRFVERNFDLDAVLSAVPDSVHEYKDSLLVRFIISEKGFIEHPEFSGAATAAFRNAIVVLLKKSPAWQPEIQGSGGVKSYVSYQFMIWQVADTRGVIVQPAKFPKQPVQ